MPCPSGDRTAILAIWVAAGNGHFAACGQGKAVPQPSLPQLIYSSQPRMEGSALPRAAALGDRPPECLHTAPCSLIRQVEPLRWLPRPPEGARHWIASAPPAGGPPPDSPGHTPAGGRPAG